MTEYGTLNRAQRNASAYPYTSISIPGDVELTRGIPLEHRQLISEAYDARRTSRLNLLHMAKKLASKLCFGVAHRSKSYTASNLTDDPIVAETFENFHEHLLQLVSVTQNGPCRAISRRRLRILRQKYVLFKALNIDVENILVCEKGPPWYQTTRANIGVRADRFASKTSIMSAITKALNKDTDEQLKSLCRKIRTDTTVSAESLGILLQAKSHQRTLDDFGMQKVRPHEGSKDLLRHVLRYDSPYLSEGVIALLEKTDPACSLNLSLLVHGTGRNEWRTVIDFALNIAKSRPSVTFSIQISGKVPMEVDNFHSQLQNIFEPFFESYGGNPEWDWALPVLDKVVSFSVSGTSGGHLHTFRRPRKYLAGSIVAPPVLLFYMSVHLEALKAYKATTSSDVQLHRCTSSPQLWFSCEENVDVWLLATSYLLCDQVAHATTLTKHPLLCYLFYLHQIYLTLSLRGRHSNAEPVMEYLLSAGLQLSLCTEDPLQRYNHIDALLEEYDAARNTGRVNSIDVFEMCNAGIRMLNHLSEHCNMNSTHPKADCENYIALDEILYGRDEFRKACLFHEHFLLRTNQLTECQDAQSVPEPSSSKPAAITGDTRSECFEETKRVLDTNARPFIRVHVSPRQSVARHDLSRQVSKETRSSQACAPSLYKLLRHALDLRKKYFSFQCEKQDSLSETLSFSPVARLSLSGLRSKNHASMEGADAKISVFNSSNSVRYVQGIWTCTFLHHLPFVSEYYDDFSRIQNILDNPSLQNLCRRRLNVLLSKFELHEALNAELEKEKGIKETRQDHRDLYHTIKVDTHCHMAAGMTAKELLDYVKEQFTNHGDDIVLDDRTTSLAELQQQLQVQDVESLTVDALDVQADRSVWERFDTFNSKYNPLGLPALRKLFLKTDNAVGGRYIAEIIKRVFRKNLKNQFSYTELRVSIYGRKRDEWSKLAHWFMSHGMSSKSNRFLIQIPRIYQEYRKAQEVTSFAELLENIFLPLWEVSIDVSSDPDLHNFLQHISGFDSVDNESVLDYTPGKSREAIRIFPHQWTRENNPPYWYWMYYLWANLQSLNAYREQKGLGTFSFRPHCGESGSSNHLIDGFLLATGINHGINLRSNAPLQYLFYLAQIPIAVSPLSNNSICLRYTKNPFPYFFKRGLAVSLSTDDPLQFHHTSQPLIEEYSIAAKIFKLSATDMCELARYSVLHCGFSHEQKKKWLGSDYYLSSCRGNQVGSSHVPGVRVAFRFETYHDELRYIEGLKSDSEQDLEVASISHLPRAMMTLAEETEHVARQQNNDKGPQSKL